MRYARQRRYTSKAARVIYILQNIPRRRDSFDGSSSSAGSSAESSDKREKLFALGRSSPLTDGAGGREGVRNRAESILRGRVPEATFLSEQYLSLPPSVISANSQIVIGRKMRGSQGRGRKVRARQRERELSVDRRRRKKEKWETNGTGVSQSAPVLALAEQ